MTTVRIVFEQGLTLHRDGQHWLVANTPRDNQRHVRVPAEITDQYGLRPVLATERFDDGSKRTLLLAQSKPGLFGLHITDIQQTMLRTEEMHSTTSTLLYLLGALEYHCVRLCEDYAAACEDFHRFPATLTNHSRVVFGGRGDCYYEFEALVTTIRRVYDALRFPLWHFFGPGKGHLPLSYYKTFPLCNRLPSGLAQDIRENWDTLGSRMKEYRDCIQHYAPVAYSQGTVYMERGPADAWTMRALIPDNPEIRTAKRFTFSHNLDALTLGWDSANSLLSLCKLVLETIEQASAKAIGLDSPGT